MEWISGFSLPDNESECNALRTGDDPKPVQWIDDKCSFFIPTDEARLGMSKCTAEQMFDMSNNTCSEKVVDTACGADMYRASEGTECVAAPVNELSFVDSGEAYGSGKVMSIMEKMVGKPETHTRDDENGNLIDICPRNNSFFINGSCKACPSEAPFNQEEDMCVCTDTTMAFDPLTNSCIASTDDSTDDSTEAFSNRKRNLSDRDILMLIIIVGLMYRYRKEIKKAFSK